VVEANQLPVSFNLDHRLSMTFEVTPQMIRIASPDAATLAEISSLSQRGGTGTTPAFIIRVDGQK